MKISKPVILLATAAATAAMPACAHAGGGIVDALNLAPFVPMVLDALMTVATGGYEFFVGHGDGIIYILVWGFLVLSISIGLLKMYFPKIWTEFFGFSGGGEMAAGKVTGFGLVQDKVLKPVVRGLIAAVVLLQLRPVYLTQWLINPFLQFGAIYTDSILDTIKVPSSAPQIECPPDIIAKGWISKSSCEFMVRPVSDISNANNQVIKRGFDYINSGLRGLITLIPHGGADFMNLVTGLILVFTFVGSNLFMALLIIQAIFNFGMSLTLYPFQVLTYVAKPSDKWFDIWPAFSGVTTALQKLLITMIACAFILCINVAIINALFQWNNSIFVVAASGTSVSNVPQIANSASGFGQHSILWLSSILTFYLMFKIFDMTRGQLNKYVGSDMSALYNSVKSDSKTLWNNGKSVASAIKTAAGWIKKK